MTLTEISKKYIQAVEKLGEKLPQLSHLEQQYQSKYYEYLLASQRGSQGAREAEAHKYMEQEDIYIKYWELKVEIKVLQIQIECYKTISSNLRNISFGGDTNVS